jgi:hypothetical protein
MKKKFKANISLTTVLVTTTIILLGGISVLLSSMDLANITKSSYNKMLNELRSRSCLEEGLRRIKINTGFTGTASITYSDGNCVATVGNDPSDSNKKIITIVSTLAEYQYNLTKHIDISTDPFTIID